MRRNVIWLLGLSGLFCFALARAQIGTHVWQHPSVGYQGPCDVISGGCAEATSMTHGMLASYSGNLFQLYNGTTTQNVGMTNHVANTSGVPAFCKGVVCRVSGVFGQISGILYGPVNSTSCTGGCTVAAPAACSGGTGNVCASPYVLDPLNGLPSLVTTFPTEYDANATGITGGANPLSQFIHGRNEAYPFSVGMGHTPTQSPLVNGTDFMATLWSTSTSEPTFANMKCGGATDQCHAMDFETTFGPYTASFAPGAIGGTYQTGATGDVFLMDTFTGNGTTGTVTYYANSSTALKADSPPPSWQDTPRQAAESPGTHLKFGCGGDCTQATGISRDVVLTNTVLASSDFTNIKNNLTTFYGAHTSAAACHGMGDLAYFYQKNGDYKAYFGPITTGVAVYALAQVNASYTGPIVDLNNGTTTNTYGSAQAAGSAGCGLDPAAATFCSGGCSIRKVYYQTFWNSSGTGNVHDTQLDMVCAAANAPTVTFSGLNGLPIMHFGGSAFCAIGTPASRFVSFNAFSAVARRTGNTSNYGEVVDLPTDGADAFASEQEIGFGNATDRIFFYMANGTNNTEVDMNLSVGTGDNHWHHMYGEDQGGTWNFWTDNVAAGSTRPDDGAGIGSQKFPATSWTIGGKDGVTQNLTGDIASVTLLSINSANTNGWSSQESAAFSQEKATWGTLPN